MRKSEADFVELMATGDYYVIHKAHDRNHDDLTLKRCDGEPADVQNFPYRVNQLPAYIFNEFLKEGLLREDGRAECGGAIFRPTGKALQKSLRAA
jgi:hypothetical protein